MGIQQLYLGGTLSPYPAGLTLEAYTAKGPTNSSGFASLSHTGTDTRDPNSYSSGQTLRAWVTGQTGMIIHMKINYSGILRFKLAGAMGGYTQPGDGAIVYGNIDLSGYTDLYAYIGSMGMSINYPVNTGAPSGGYYTIGGWNGGGRGMSNSSNTTGGNTGGGGGATDVRTTTMGNAAAGVTSAEWDNATDFSNRIIVAGGGGGSTGNGGSDGGDGGYPSGGNGSGGGQAGGGTQSAGGSMGGAFGKGGENNTNTGWNGGGGGGYYGGGSDPAQHYGGGGGSSYANSSIFSSISHSGTNGGHGYFAILKP